MTSIDRIRASCFRWSTGGKYVKSELQYTCINCGGTAAQDIASRFQSNVRVGTPRSQKRRCAAVMRQEKCTHGTAPLCLLI